MENYSSKSWHNYNIIHVILGVIYHNLKPLLGLYHARLENIASFYSISTPFLHIKNLSNVYVPRCLIGTEADSPSW